HNADGSPKTNAAVYADAINILSGGWNDNNSTLSTPNRVATSTTVNAAFVTGEVPSGNGYYSGGGENFVRFLEDWQKNSTTFTYELLRHVSKIDDRRFPDGHSRHCSRWN